MDNNIQVIAPFELNKKEIDIMQKKMMGSSYTVTFKESLFPWERNLDGITGSEDVIVSRGGLGDFLHKEAKIPYVHIPVTPFDLLRAVSKATDEGFQNIAVIMFDQIMKTEQTLSLSLKDDSIKLFSYRHEDELFKLIDGLLKKGEIDAVIGDRRATIIAESFDIPAHLLKSGQEALSIAIEQAVRTLEFKQLEESKLNELQLVLQSMQQAVIIVDTDNQIKTYNQKAISLFPNLTNGDNIKNYKEIVQNTELDDLIDSKEKEHKLLLEVNDNKVLVTNMVIVTNDRYSGTIQIFEKLNDIQQLEMDIRKKLHQKGLIAKHDFSDIIFADEAMKRTIEQASIYAQSEGAVLIEGETGTGKELFAQSIHNASNRKNKPFVAINCGSLSESLLESELFGYEEGAFTGARKGGSGGLLELAHGGTLFLDEINEMSRSFQTKMLRVIQEQEVRRVGGERNIPVDVRIICASNIPLEDLILEKKFKEDFFYRISTLHLKLLPLRYRKKDIVELAVYFLKQEMEIENRYLVWEDNKVFTSLLSHPWYGNSRELQNVIKRFVITYPQQEITQNSFKNFLNQSISREKELIIPMADSYKGLEKNMWKSLYEQFDGTKKEFCDKYGISSTTLWRKISN